MLNFKLKRKAYITLIFLVLIIAIQPIISVHYCHGEIDSVNFTNSHVTNCCDDNPEDGIYMGECCNEETVAISTDNYQAPKIYSVIGFVSSFMVILNNLFLSESLSVVVKRERIYSFESLFDKALDRLSYICVYKI